MVKKTNAIKKYVSNELTTVEKDFILDSNHNTKPLTAISTNPAILPFCEPYLNIKGYISDIVINIPHKHPPI